MLKLKEAEKIINQQAFFPSREKVDLYGSLGRILAEEIRSAIPMPPFDKSAMDGYALLKSDSSRQFKVISTIPAGIVPDVAVKTGECVKIMTGAMLPGGTDRVVKKEITSELDGYMTILGGDENDNVCQKGEDVSPGDLLIQPGVRIKPPHIGIFASAGLNSVRVFKKPVVGIVTTGSEIIEPGTPLKTGQIYNSNSYSIGAQYLAYGCEIIYEGVAVDDKQKIRRSIEKMLKEADVVAISGGVSMGDFDFVPEVLREIGVQIHFEKVAVKPGKPVVYGTFQGKAVFGLPGNPVSTFVINEVFIKPLLFRAMGDRKVCKSEAYAMGWDFHRKKRSRTAYIPVKLKGDTVQKIEYHGSAHIHALAGADGLLEIPEGVCELNKGAGVNVRLI